MLTSRGRVARGTSTSSALRSTRARWITCPALALLGAVSVASLANADEKATPAPTDKKQSTAKDRKKVALTVYNENFGLVREVRSIDLGAAGKSSLEVADVAATIQPETVAMKATGLDVLEQNYRYDLLTPETMLEKYVGKTVRAYRYNKAKGKDDAYDAKVIAVNPSPEGGGTPILEIDGRITTDFPGRLAFPGVPENLISRPTLVWLLDAKQPKGDVEITYMASGMGWNADYVLVVNDDDTKADLSGWVTLRNDSGASYEQAELKLVAGDVNRITNRVPEPMKPDAPMHYTASTGFNEEALFEYHLYTLDRPTDVLENEQKQVSLLSANGVAVQKRLMFRGQSWWYRGRYGQVVSDAKVGVYLDLQNSEKQGLGMPLPRGAVRVYKEDKSKARQFIGEDAIDHTPRDEKVHVKMGDAFDVVGDRKQTSYKEIGECTVETEWEIEIRNHKDKAVTVEDWEPIDGDWEIVSSSQPSTKKDAHTFVFDIAAPANGKKTVTYKVRIKYC
ncbi:MAG: DUF4139 domain-containing protein [Polyangiaceae bacterium]